MEHVKFPEESQENKEMNPRKTKQNKTKQNKTKQNKREEKN
jgi:hypothetical protein